MRRQVLALPVIFLLTLNPRPIRAGLGPLLDLIVQSTGIRSAGAGMLTSLPVFLMGLGAFAGPHLRRLLGERNGIALGIALLRFLQTAQLLATCDAAQRSAAKQPRSDELT